MALTWVREDTPVWEAAKRLIVGGVVVSCFLAVSAGAAPPSTAPTPVELLGATSPRGALFLYLNDARQARWRDAARSLDLSQIPDAERVTQGPVLARKLKVVLDRTIWFDLDKISDGPGGTVTEGLPDDVERIGDYCRFGTQEGWVEDIGLRSTRVRTPARTVISIPNSVFSSVDIENLTSRDRMRFFTTLNLRYETTPDQLREVLLQLRALLGGHPKVGSELLRVRFTAFGPSSLNIDLNAYILTASIDEFLEIRESLLLQIMELVSKAGSGFAFPSQTVYMTRDQGLGKAGRPIPQP